MAATTRSQQSKPEDNKKKPAAERKARSSTTRRAAKIKNNKKKPAAERKARSSTKRRAAKINIKASLQDLVKIYRDGMPGELKQYTEGLEAAVNTAFGYYTNCTPDEFSSKEDKSDSDRANLIVLSESHARTHPDIIGRQILLEYKWLIPEDHPSLRFGHLNYVGSPSYGEGDAIGTDDKNARGGTNKFEQVYTGMSGKVKKVTEHNIDRIMAPLLKRNTKDMVQRLKQKLRIMQEMDRRGNKLLDVSPAPIYLASGTITRVSKKTGKQYTTPRHKIPDKLKKKILQYSWENITKPILERERPQKILVLGKTLTDDIGEGEIKAFAKSIGASYEGTMLHPSYNKLSPADRVHTMNELCRLAAPTVTPEPEVTARVRPRMLREIADYNALPQVSMDN